MDQWYTAGIEIKLLTGDFSGTAMHIARLAGIRFKEAVLTGKEVMEMEEAALRLRVQEVDIFARMFPEAKLKVVDALKANGEIVAMTGDGVNDGPALKSSHVGIAMGGRGTEIAKEAADLILTDDQLDKITQAIRQGRKIYANLKKAVRYIISIHIPIILTASVPLILGWKYGNIFSPIHIIFLELIMGPTCSIFYEREPEEPNSMQQPPRKRSFSLFSWYELWISVLQGGVIAVFLLAVFYFLMRTGYPVNYVRAAVFMTLILNNFFLTFVNRSFEQSALSSFRNRNNLAPWLLLITLIFVLALSFIYPVQTLFQLEKISTLHFFYCLLISMLSAGWLEIYKYLLRLKTRRS
jgi:Ca2+-transporting ATPase